MMCEGSIAAILPTVTLSKFGVIRGHDVFSFMYSSYGVSALLGSLLVGSLQYLIGFTGMIGIALAFVIFACILTYRMDDKHIFNFGQFDKKEIYGATFSNKYGIQVREMGMQTELFP